MRTWVLATAVVIALLVTSANSQVLPAEPCKPTILEVSEPVYPGEVLTIRGTCFGDGDGSYLRLGDETQRVDVWTDTLISVTVLVQDPQATVTIAKADFQSVSAGILMSRVNRPSDTSMIVPGRVMVRVKEGTDVAQLATSVDSTKLTRHFPERLGTRLGRWWELEVPPGDEVTDIYTLAESPNVEWAEPVFVGEAAVTPNDVCFLPPLSPECAGSYQWGLEKIQAAQAWSYTKGSPVVSIAVIDSGVDFGHVDLSPKFESEEDFTGTGLGDGCPISLPGHASHVAGIAAAATNNVEGIAGVSWLSKIRSYKVLYDEFDAGQQAWKCRYYTPSLAFAIDKAGRTGADVINLSLRQENHSQELANAVASAWNDGAVLVGGAGNEGNTVQQYPAAYREVIAVSASGTLDERPSWSSYGSWVDIAAPGADILSTVPGDAYAIKSGTSLAAPHVSGVAALLAAVGLNHCEIVATILNPSNVDPITWDGGVGRLNALKAVNGPFTSDTWDSDCDGFTDTVELFVGTDWLKACASTPTYNDEPDDKWPLDTNDSQFVNVLDVTPFIPVLNSVWPGPPYTQRLDLNANLVINVFDLVPYIPALNTGCDP